MPQIPSSNLWLRHLLLYLWQMLAPEGKERLAILEVVASIMATSPPIPLTSSWLNQTIPLLSRLKNQRPGRAIEEYRRGEGYRLHFQNIPRNSSRPRFSASVVPRAQPWRFSLQGLLSASPCSHHDIRSSIKGAPKKKA